MLYPLCANSVTSNSVLIWKYWSDLKIYLQKYFLDDPLKRLIKCVWLFQIWFHVYAWLYILPRWKRGQYALIFNGLQMLIFSSVTYYSGERNIALLPSREININVYLLLNLKSFVFPISKVSLSVLCFSTFSTLMMSLYHSRYI